MKILLASLLTLLLYGCGSKSIEELLIGRWVSKEDLHHTAEFTEKSVYFKASLNDIKEYRWSLAGDTIYLKMMESHENDSLALLILKINDYHLEFAEGTIFSEGFGETKNLIKQQ